MRLLRAIRLAAPDAFISRSASQPEDCAISRVFDFGDVAPAAFEAKEFSASPGGRVAIDQLARRLLGLDFDGEPAETASATLGRGQGG